MWWFFPPDRLDRVKDGNGDLVFDVRQLADEGGAIKVLQQVRVLPCQGPLLRMSLIGRKGKSSSSRQAGTTRS